jgi:uncharacterized protein (DUF1330 family)
MAAYVVLMREKMHDPAEFATYSKMAPGAMTGHAASVLAAYGRHETLEGEPVEGVVVISFPTYVEAKAWYDSPAYTAAREHRFKGADYRTVIVEGL